MHKRPETAFKGQWQQPFFRAPLKMPRLVSNSLGVSCKLEPDSLFSCYTILCTFASILRLKKRPKNGHHFGDPESVTSCSCSIEAIQNSGRLRNGGFYVGVVSCCGFLLEFELALKVAHRIFVGIDLRDLQAERHMAAGANIPFTQSTGLGGISVTFLGFDVGFFLPIWGRPGAQFRS